MKLLKIGSRGVNIANITGWTVDQRAASTRDRQPASAGGHYESVTLTYIGGSSETFTDDEATALRQWLETQAEDIQRGQ